MTTPGRGRGRGLDGKPGGKPGGKLGGKLGKRRGLVLAGGAAAVVAVVALARRKAAAGSSAGATTLRVGSATPYTYNGGYGGNPNGVNSRLWAELDKLRDELLKDRREIWRLEHKHPKRGRHPKHPKHPHPKRHRRRPKRHDRIPPTRRTPPNLPASVFRLPRSAA